MKFFYLRFLPALLISVAVADTAIAQANQFAKFLQAGVDDGSKLTEAFFNPVMEGFTYGINGGWYHTARTHDRLGFDISVTATGVFFPSSSLTFRPADLGLEHTVLIGGNGSVPTMIGAKTETTFETTINTPGGPETITFSGAQGLNFGGRWLVRGMTVPMFQAAVGIGEKTDAKLRFIPTIGLGSVTRAGLVGLGFQHDIKQHIGAWRDKPFDLSLLVGYTRVAGEIRTAISEMPRPEGDTEPQETSFKVHSFLIQALISKQIQKIGLYGGIGYNTSRSYADMMGSYIIFGEGTANAVVLTDPLSLSFRENSLRITAGGSLTFGHFSFYGDYSYQGRSGVTLGAAYRFERETNGGVNEKEVKVRRKSK
jgi:hypothetical protein